MAASAIAIGLTGIWAVSRPDVFAAQGSYILRAEAGSTSDLVRAATTLARSDELINTYANIATSELISDAARAATLEAGLDPSGSRAESETVAEANVLLIGATSEDPETALTMARAVGVATQDYLLELGDAFQLETLDTPTLPDSPAPKGAASMLVGSGLIGVIVGVGLAISIGRVVPSRRRQMKHIVDPVSTAFNKPYFELRLRDELARAEAVGQTFSVGVVRVLRRATFDHDILEPADLRTSQLTAVTTGIQPTLQPKDVLAHLGRGRFGVILPLISLGHAREIAERWRQVATIELLGSPNGSELVVLAGACEFTGDVCVGDDDSVLIVSGLVG